jgi:gliding motility-associated-like protein
VRVTDKNFCSSTSDFVNVSAKALPAKPSILYAEDLDLCPGEDIKLTSTEAFGYKWATGETTQSIMVNTSGSYQLKIINIDGCESELSDIVEVNSKQAPSIPTIAASGQLTFCSDDSIELTSSNAYSYLWSTGATTKRIKVKESGNYSLIIKNEDGCQSTVSETKLVNVLPLPIKPAIIASGALKFCMGDSVLLNSGSDMTCEWSNGAISKEITVKNSGNYKSRVIDQNGCRSLFSESIDVVVYPLPGKPLVKASDNITMCKGDIVSLECDFAAGYLWSTGERGKTIDVFLSGDYFVRIIDENGCKSSASEILHVVVNPLPEKPLITASGPLNFCKGDSLTLLCSTGAEYIWSTGEKTSQIIVKETGTYNVRIKNIAGCLSERSTDVNVVVNPLPNVFLNSEEVMCINSTMEIKGMPEGGIFIVKEGSATIRNNLLKPTVAGNLVIEYTYTDLCPATAKKRITVNELPEANAGTDQQVTFSHETDMTAELLPSERGEWSLISGKGQIIDNHSSTTKIIGLGEGMNVFQWKVSKDECFATDDVVITVSDLVIPSVITPNGDGDNDIFYIAPAYGKLKILIFNKWGNLEYTADNYMNDWDGRNSKGVALPNDTYFFILHFVNGTIKKGSLLIKK